MSGAAIAELQTDAQMAANAMHTQKSLKEEWGASVSALGNS